MCNRSLSVTLSLSFSDNKLYDSFEDVNYHSENKHLGFAIEEMENPGQDVNQAMANIEDYLEDFNKACLETLKDITKGKVQ